MANEIPAYYAQSTIQFVQRPRQEIEGLLAALGLPLSLLSEERQAGVVTTRRDGINVYYSLRSERISEACSLTRQILVENLEDQMAMMKGK